MNVGNIGLGSLGLGGLDQAELQRRIAQYQSGIGNVPAPTTAPKAVAPKPTPVPYRGGPPTPSFGPVAPKPAPVKAVAPKPAITDNRVPGAGVDYVAPTPTAAKPTTPAVDTTDPIATKINSSDPAIAAKAAEDLRSMYRGLGIDPKNLKGVVSPEIMAALKEPTDPKYTMGKYKDFLMSGTSKNFNSVVDDVDELDNFYDKGYASKILGGVTKPIEATFTSEEYVDQTGSPEYLKSFRTVTSIKDTRNAYGSIAGVSGLGGTSAVLSDHYGYDYKPAEIETREFGGNLESHTSSNAAELSEFQSLVRPILKEQIPYLQATEGLGYQDALMEAYKRDPMLQSLYAKYDVTPARQTKDGSAYLYDPMSYAEIRTKEVKDTSVKDAIKIAAIIAASVYGGGFLAGSGMFGGAGAGVAAGAATPGFVGTGLAYGTASGLTTAATGGDLEDVAKSFVTAGLTAGAGAYAKGLATNAAELGKAASVAEKAAQATTGAGMGVYNAEALKAAADATKAFKTATNAAATFNKTVKGVKFITKAVSGDAAGAAISLYGDNLTKGALNKAGFNEEFLNKYNINQDDLTAGLVKTQLEIAGGAEVGDALISGLGQYIQEGGSIGPNKIKAPEFLSRAAKVLRTVGKGIDDKLIEPVKDAAKPIAKGIRKIGKGFDDKIIEPILDPIKAAGKKFDDKVIEPILDPIKAAGSAVDDATKPVREGVSDIVKDTVKATGLGVKEVIALLTGGAGAGSRAGSRAGSSALAGAGVRGSTPGIIEEKAPDLFTLGEREEEENPYDIANYLSSLSSGPEDVGMVKIASGGMITNYTKQIPDSTLDDLLRIVGSRR